MATVVRKSNPRDFRLSANTPDFPSADWLINPVGFATLYGIVQTKYWKLNVAGDDIEEMSQGEKDAVDAAETAQQVTDAKVAADSAIDGNDGYNLRAIAKLTIDEINALRQWITAFKVEVAAATNLSNLQSRVANNLPNMPDRTLAQAKTTYKSLISGTELDE